MDMGSRLEDEDTNAVSVASSRHGKVRRSRPREVFIALTPFAAVLAILYPGQEHFS
jgi:hypothetical protein